jgi:hypothetical protein
MDAPESLGSSSLDRLSAIRFYDDPFVRLLVLLFARLKRGGD